MRTKSASRMFERRGTMTRTSSPRRQASRSTDWSASSGTKNGETTQTLCCAPAMPAISRACSVSSSRSGPAASTWMQEFPETLSKVAGLWTSIDSPLAVSQSEQKTDSNTAAAGPSTSSERSAQCEPSGELARYLSAMLRPPTQASRPSATTILR